MSKTTMPKPKHKPTFRELLVIGDGPYAGDYFDLYWYTFKQWPKPLVRNNITIATKYIDAIISGEATPQDLADAVKAYLSSTSYPCDLGKWMTEEGWRTYMTYGGM